MICIDTDATQKDISNAFDAVDDERVSYIFSFVGLEDNDNVKRLMNEYSSIKKLELHKLDNLTDEERTNDKNYQIIMRDNLELLKKELYQ